MSSWVDNDTGLCDRCRKGMTPGQLAEAQDKETERHVGWLRPFMRVPEPKRGKKTDDRPRPD